MTKQMSIILNTARSGYSMIGFPDVHHFNYTIEALRRQNWKNFELIISDYLYDRRLFDWNGLRETPFPIYHVPIEHSIFKNKGYVAISATKNNGIMYADGNILFFLDDCCAFASNLLEQIFIMIVKTNIFPNALHVKELGSWFYRDANGNQIRDCRYAILEPYVNQTGSNVLVDNFHMYGYSTCTLEAALKLNGFDEMLDGSRQLEDIDFGERLKAAGYHIGLTKSVFVSEQEHKQIAPDPENDNRWHPVSEEDPVRFGPNLKCNGPFFYMFREKPDRIKANECRLSHDEIKKINPCYLQDGKTCKASNLTCNWMDGDKTRHMVLPDSRIYIENPPIFNLTELRNQRLSKKESYRVK